MSGLDLSCSRKCEDAKAQIFDSDEPD